MVLVVEEWGMWEWHTQPLNVSYWRKERSSDEASVAETAVNFMHCLCVLLFYKHFWWHFPLQHRSSIFGFPLNSFIIVRGCFYTVLHLYFPGVGFVVLVLFCFGFAVVQYVFGFAFRYFGQLFIAGKCIPSGSTGAIQTTNSTKMYLLWQQQQFQQFRII